MIGDKIDMSAVNREMIKALLRITLPRLHEKGEKFVISIAGESGSGKSVIAHAFARELNERGVPAWVIQQDDYFFHPPQTNDRLRRENFEHVGIGEINLELMDHHISLFKAGASHLEKPMVNYEANQILKENMEIKNLIVLIVEGTYTSLLENIDLRIFIDRDYRQTFLDRQRRARDASDAFIEKVLEKEHQIIAPHKKSADVIITADFSLQIPDQNSDK